MANKIFRDLIKPQARLSRNGFDRSYLHNFTAKIGELLPVMAVETVPGSHYEINVSDLMRTIPMNSASFIRASQHFEFYFVPYKQLWHRWDDFYTQRSVGVSTSVDTLQVPSCAPVFDLTQLNNTISALNTTGGTTEAANIGQLGEFVGQGMSKIQNLLGYGSYKWFQYEPSPVSYKPNPFRAAAYQKIFFDYYRQPFYDTPQWFDVYSYNLDDADISTGQISYNLIDPDSGADIYRLGLLFQLHYRQWKKDLFTGVIPNTQFGAVASVGGSAPVTVNVSSTGQVQINAGDITVEGRGVNGAWSPGWIPTDPPFDLNIDPNERAGVQGGVTDGFIADTILGQTGTQNNARIQLTNPDGVRGYAAVQGQGTATVGATFNVLQLVRAQALQRWREITLRSGYRNTDQYQGHFGVTPIFSEKDKCVFIDSVSSPLQVNSVVNTNAGSYVGDTRIPLGDMGANGTSVIRSDRTIKFDAKDFGVIMCIYSVLPEATYQHDGIDFMNQKVLRDDFYTPEYENIGLQPVPMSGFLVNSLNTDSINGYAPRYFEYKTGIDIQSDEFRSAYSNQGALGPTLTPAGRFDGWSPARAISLSWEDSGIVSPRLFARDLYVSPLYYKDIFVNLPYASPSSGVDWVTSFRRSVGDSQYDSFIHQCYFDVKCVQPMSVLGLPSY